jgi:hypothetical protein
VGTAYHIQMLVGRSDLGIDGAHTEKVLSLANKSDTGRTDIPVEVDGIGNKTLSYNPAHDVSFVYTARSVQHKSGIAYSYRCHVGQPVLVAGYYKGHFQTTKARIIGLDIPLAVGQSRLNENIILDIAVQPGMSGSAVVDEQGNLLGMLTLAGAIKQSDGDLTASVALPTKTIAKALMKLDPVLGAAVFNDLPENDLPENEVPENGLRGNEVAGDEPASGENLSVSQEDDRLEAVSSVIPELTAVPSKAPDAVTNLRARAAAASEGMVNVVAKQCLKQSARKALCHELTVIAGVQTFREIHGNGKLGKPGASFPKQQRGVWILSDWAETLGEIADNPWTFQGLLNGYYLFNFESIAADDRCYWEDYSGRSPLFGGGHADWKGSVACFEWVLADKDFNVRAAFTEMHPPSSCPTQTVETAIYYDWIKLEGSASPVLLPVGERVAANVSGQKKLLSAEVTWTDYRAFRAEHKVKF